MSKLENKTREDFVAELTTALADNDAAQFEKAFTGYAKNVQNEIITEAKRATDDQVAAMRGRHPLTSAERDYYMEVIAAGGFEGIEQAVPATIIDRVFDDLVQSHELINAVDAVNTGGITKWIYSSGDAPLAVWGKLCEPITKEIEAEISEADTGLYKLSAFIPVCRAMLDLGPEWLDRYVVTLLTEALANGIEYGIVAGTGADQPIGMIRDLDKPVAGGGFEEKTPIAITDLSPATLGGTIMAALSQNGTRNVTNVIFVVNPNTYYSKIFPQTTYLNNLGQYVYNVLPIDVTIIQSKEVPVDRMIAGRGRDYFFALGMTRPIEKSDDVRFFEDERVYKAVQYGNGLPKDNISFLYLDVSGLPTPTPTEP